MEQLLKKIFQIIKINLKHNKLIQNHKHNHKL